MCEVSVGEESTLCVFVSVCTVRVAATPHKASFPWLSTVHCYCPVNVRVEKRLKPDPLTQLAWVTYTHTGTENMFKFCTQAHASF